MRTRKMAAFTQLRIVRPMNWLVKSTSSSTSLRQYTRFHFTISYSGMHRARDE